MPICAQAVQQADGSYLLGLDPAQTNLAQCAYVVYSGQDNTLLQVLNLSPDDALTLAASVGGLWVVAWCLWAVRRALFSEDGPAEE